MALHLERQEELKCYNYREIKEREVVMNIENFKVLKLKESLYKNEVLESDDKIIYGEIQYKRDRSSFAGIAFRLVDEGNTFVVKGCEEYVVQNISKYEKMYIGCEQSYLEAMRETCFSKTKDYGIEVVFLVYSDVRSSQIIFEELMERIDTNIERIKEIC